MESLAGIPPRYSGILPSSRVSCCKIVPSSLQKVMIYLGNAIGSCLNIGYPPFTFTVSATQWRYCPSELFASTQALRASRRLFGWLELLFRTSWKIPLSSNKPILEIQVSHSELELAYHGSTSKLVYTLSIFEFEYTSPNILPLTSIPQFVLMHSSTSPLV